MTAFERVEARMHTRELSQHVTLSVTSDRIMVITPVRETPQYWMAVAKLADIAVEEGWTRVGEQDDTGREWEATSTVFMQH